MKRLRIEGNGVPPHGTTRVIDLDTGKPIEGVRRIVLDMGVDQVTTVTLELVCMTDPEVCLDITDVSSETTVRKYAPPSHEPHDVRN